MWDGLSLALVGPVNRGWEEVRSAHLTIYLLHSGQDKSRTSYVGFANLPNQVFRKAVKRGFQFTLMAVGEGVKCVRREGAPADSSGVVDAFSGTGCSVSSYIPDPSNPHSCLPYTR